MPKKERERKRGKRKKEGKKGEREKIKDRKANQHNERGAIQVQTGAPGKRTSGAPNWEEMRATFFNFAPGRPPGYAPEPVTFMNVS